MNKREKFIEKMVELLTLGEDIIDEFYDEFEEEVITDDEFVEEVSNMCFHIATGLNILKKI